MPKKRLTVGCRARIKPSSSWARSSWGYADREVLLIERSGKQFSVIVLPKGTNIPLVKPKVGEESCVQNQIAWVSESDLTLVDTDFDTNLNFIDWGQEHEEDFCPDCSVFMGEDPSCNGDGDYLCPSCGCEYG